MKPRLGLSQISQFRTLLVFHRHQRNVEKLLPNCACLVIKVASFRDGSDPDGPQRYLQTFLEIRFFCWQPSLTTFPPTKLTSQYLKFRNCQIWVEKISLLCILSNMPRHDIMYHIILLKIHLVKRDRFVGELIWVTVTQASAAWQTSNTRAPPVQIPGYRQSWIPCEYHIQMQIQIPIQSQILIQMQGHHQSRYLPTANPGFHTNTKHHTNTDTNTSTRAPPVQIPTYRQSWIPCMWTSNTNTNTNTNHK